MAYTSTIATLRGNELIHIEIDGTDVGTGELILTGSDPIVIDYNSDDIFKPLKMSGCTIKVITNKNMFDLYTGKLTDITLKVWRAIATAQGEWSSEGAELIWFGYLSPNVYSSNYNNEYEELQLEFVDVISVLENVKFKKVGFFRSFKQFMLDALSKVNASSIINDIVTPTGFDIDITKVGCMERNFIDETDDEDDGAMTYKEVLEHIMRYLGLSMIYYGTKLHLINPLASGATAQNIEYYGIGKSDAQISLGNVYNKITVVENTNPMENIIDTDVFDENNQKSFMDTNDANYKSALKFYRVGKTYSGVKYMDCFGLYVTEKNWIMKNGSMTNGGTEITNTANYIISVAPFNGSNSSLSGETVYKGHTGSDSLDAGCFMLFDTFYEDGQVPSRLSFNKKCVMYADTWKIRSSDTTAGYYRNAQNTIFLSYQSPAGSVTALKGGYLILSMNWKYLAGIMTSLELDKYNPTYKYNVGDFLGETGWGLEDKWKIRLRIGNKYFNGTSWVTENSTFNVGHTWKNEDMINNTEVSLDNSATYEMGLQDTSEGCAIPISGDLFGDVQMDIYPPTYFARSTSQQHGYATCGALILSKLEFKYTTSQDLSNIILQSDSERDNDITICNIIDYANVKEFSDIELKVNTFSDKQTSYSYTIQKNGNDYSYFAPSKSQEEKIVEKYYNYYRQPRLEYTNTLKDDIGKHLLPWANINIPLLSKSFTVDSIVYDLAMNDAKVVLKEIL